MTTTLLVDLGGTRIKSALLTSPSDVSAVTHGGDWRSAVRTVVQRSGADEVALCVPGLVKDGRVAYLPGKLPEIVDADLAAVFGVRVPLVVNDAVAYGVGECRGGAGAGADRVVVVTLGTGVGVAVVEHGAPLGTGPWGGGILGGQLVVAAAGGTFEACCRAAALVAAVPGARDVEEAYALLAAGNAAAAQGFSVVRDVLVRGLVALSMAHAPDVVVVGGGACQAGLLDGVQESVEAGLWPGQSVSVRSAELGDASALVGLAALLRAQVAA